MPCIFLHGNTGVLRGCALPGLPSCPHPLLCYIWTAWLSYVTCMAPVGSALETSYQQWGDHRPWGHQPPSPISLLTRAKSPGGQKGPCGQQWLRTAEGGSVAICMDPHNSPNCHLLNLYLFSQLWNGNNNSTYHHRVQQKEYVQNGAWHTVGTQFKYL